MKELEIRRDFRIFPQGKRACSLDEYVLEEGHITRTKTIIEDVPPFVARWAARREMNQDRDSVVIDFSNPSGVTVESNNDLAREDAVAGLIEAGIKQVVPIY